MSITLTLPDKHIRKALFDLIDGITVDGQTINIYDYQVTEDTPNAYVLMTTQLNQVDESSKCGNRWESSILLDIVTKYIGAGNTGSRLFADNITDAIRNLLESDLTLAGGLNVVRQTLDFPPDISSVTANENVFRKFIRIELLIN